MLFDENIIIVIIESYPVNWVGHLKLEGVTCTGGNLKLLHRLEEYFVSNLIG